LPSRRVAEKCVAVPFQTHLGSYDHPVTTAQLRDCPADDLLRVPESVRGSGIDQCYAEVRRRVDRPHRFIVVGTAPLDSAHGPGPETYSAGRSFNVPNRCVFHSSLRLTDASLTRIFRGSRNYAAILLTGERAGSPLNTRTASSAAILRTV